VTRTPSAALASAAAGSKSCEAHLKDRVVVAEQDERNLRRFADAANEIEEAGQCGAGFQSAFGKPVELLGRQRGDR